jgi:HAD superfamily hydrolase (TIGR01509 family)
VAHRQPGLEGRPIAAVLIDAGGVLVDPNWDVIAGLLAARGAGVPAAALRAAEPAAKRELDDATVIGATTDEERTASYLGRVLRHAGIAVDPVALRGASEEVTRLHRELGLWEVVPEGTLEALDALRSAGLRLALASNADPLLRGKLGALGVAGRLDHLGISGEMGVEKPDPRFFHRILGEIGVAPERAVHVGDVYEIDVVGARAAGLTAVLVDVEDRSSDRDVIRIRGLHELPTLLGI